MTSKQANNLVLGITGASGAIYAVRLLQVLLAAGKRVQLAISPAGQAVLREELGLRVDLEDFQLVSLLPDLTSRAPRDLASQADSPGSALLAQVLGAPPAVAAPDRPGEVCYYHYRDLMAPMASGSSRTAGMVICPCSGGTLSAIAHASSENLIHRAADVHLKERRKLVLVPRETPLSTLQIENWLRCAQAGAVILPAMPGWYHGVTCIRDLVDFVVARICDQLQIEHSLIQRWGGP